MGPWAWTHPGRMPRYLPTVTEVGTSVSPALTLTLVRSAPVVMTAMPRLLVRARLPPALTVARLTALVSTAASLAPAPATFAVTLIA